MYFKKIVGEKVYLSPLDVNDAAQFAEWENELTLSYNFGTLAYNISALSERNDIEYWAKNQKAFVFAIVRLEDNALLGMCKLVDYKPNHGSAFYSIYIGNSKERNKGYGADALRILTDYGFNVLNLHSIMSSIYAFNIASLKCAEKVGYHIFGTQHECVYCGGEYYDKHLIELLKPDFNKKWKTIFEPEISKK